MLTKLVYVSRPAGGTPLGTVLDRLPLSIETSIIDVTYDTNGYVAEVEMTYDPNRVSFTYWMIMVLN